MTLTRKTNGFGVGRRVGVGWWFEGFLFPPPPFGIVVSLVALAVGWAADFFGDSAGFAGVAGLAGVCRVAGALLQTASTLLQTARSLLQTASTLLQTVSTLVQTGRRSR